MPPPKLPLLSVDSPPFAVWSLILSPGAAWCVEVALAYIRPDSLESVWKLIFLVLINVSLRFEFMLFYDYSVFCDCMFVPVLRSLGVLLFSSASPSSFCTSICF